MAYIDVIEDDHSIVLAEVLTAHDCYRLPDGTQDFISVVPAWCRECRRFVAVERLQNPEKMETHAREFFEDRERRPLLPPDIFPAEEGHAINLSMLRRGLHDAAQWRVALTSRQSPPRCLECGGTDHVVLPEAGTWTAHPGGAAGLVRVRDGCIHASMCEPGRLYDTEGRRLAGQSASWRERYDGDDE